MKKSTLLKSATMLALSGSTAMAGGLDRSGQPTSILFEEGRYLEFSYGRINPNVDGIDPAGNATGNGPEDYIQLGAAYRNDLTDNISYAFIFDEPYGSDTNYSRAGSIYNGLQSDLDSWAITALMRYEMSSGFSVYGGLRAQQVEASATISNVALASSLANGIVTNGVGALPPNAFGGGNVQTATGIILGSGFQNYRVDAESDVGYGYVFGLAYERPEIALRVALTYHSAIEHDNPTVESGTFFRPTGLNTGVSIPFTNATSTSNTDFPKAVNLDFQTGVAEDTLVFGSVRWAEYSEFRLAPANYGTMTGGRALASFAEDSVSYQLGIGRRFNDNWSGSFSVSYEDEGPTTNPSPLSPVNGRTGYTLAAIYNTDAMRITAGISYTDLGDLNVGSLGNFADNEAIAVGVRVGFKL